MSGGQVSAREVQLNALSGLKFLIPSELLPRMNPHGGACTCHADTHYGMAIQRTDSTLPLRERLAAAAAMASDQSPMSTLSSGNPQSGMAQQSFQQSKHQMKPHVQHQQLQMFWQQQNQEMEQLNEKSSKSELLMTHLTEFKNHQLPLARIKKIMKSDEDVKMIAAEAPVLFAKACEMFILELTLRSWIHTEENKRRTLQRNDIAGAITRGDIFDFLVDIVPRDEVKEEETAVTWSGVGGEQVQYGGMYYPSIGAPTVHYPMGSPDMMVVQSTMDPNQQPLYAPTQQGDMQ